MELVSRQTGELLIELKGPLGYAARHSLELRGFDAYSNSVIAGRERNGFKSSIHASGEAHLTLQRYRTRSESGPSLGYLERPLGLSLGSLSGSDGKLKWRTAPRTNGGRRRVLVVDTDAYPACWHVGLAVPPSFASRIEQLLKPAQYLGEYVGHAVMDWAVPHLVLAVYGFSAGQIEAMGIDMAHSGFEMRNAVCGPPLPTVIDWVAFARPDAS